MQQRAGLKAGGVTSSCLHAHDLPYSGAPDPFCLYVPLIIADAPHLASESPLQAPACFFLFFFGFSGSSSMAMVSTCEGTRSKNERSSVTAAGTASTDIKTKAGDSFLADAACGLQGTKLEMHSLDEAPIQGPHTGFVLKC